jgi:radical SAM protein with 4Fe4S-binding SPASM domain
MPAKERLPLPDLRRVVDFFVDYTNRAAMRPRELFFVLNTLGEPALGIENVLGVDDYVTHINKTGRCAVPAYFALTSTNLTEVPDGLVQYVNRLGYLAVALHNRPATEFAARVGKFQGHVIVEGTDVIPKRPVNLFARYREILEHFDLAAMHPVRESVMTMDDAALWADEFSECLRTLTALPDAELADFLAHLSFNDTILNALSMLNTGAEPCYRCSGGIDSLQVTPELEFYPCLFTTTHPDLCMGGIEHGVNLDWCRRFEARRRAHARPECASCDCRVACGGCCLDWARKDPLGDGYFSPTECAYRRGLVKAVRGFMEHVKGRPPVMEALQKRFTLCNQEWQPKQKGD